MKKAFAAGLLCGLAVWTAAAAGLPEGWKKLFGWNRQLDIDAAAVEFEHAGHADESSAVLQLLLDRRSVLLDQQLKALSERLLRKFTAAPDKINAFLLAEIFNHPASPYYDVDLALKLYKYSARHGLELAACRAGSILIHSSADDDLQKALSYLEQASQANISEADYQLFVLYKKLDRQPEAQAALERLIIQQHPAATALQALENNNLTEQLAGSSEYTMRCYALHYCRNGRDKKEFLQHALELGDKYSALLLAVFFNDQPKPDHAMAINSALLAAYLYNGSAKSQALLDELDSTQGLAMALQAMWQNRLRCNSALRLYRSDSNSAVIDLTLNDSPENRRAIAELLKKDPQAFFLSGCSFRLLDFNYTAEDFKKLFKLVPANIDPLPQLITALLIAAKLDDAVWQLELSGKLLAQLARITPPEKRPDFRKQLLTVLPEAATSPPETCTISDPLLSYYMLWNLAIDMRVNALLASGRKDAAEAFLKKYHRYRLPPAAQRQERNMVRHFARHLLAPDNKK